MESNLRERGFMSGFKDPFDPVLHLGAGCVCGVHRTQHEHDAALAADDDVESLNRRVIESAVMRALFPRDETRRRFIRAVGVSTAYAAVASAFPFGALEAMAQERKPPEKKDLKVGFISITCASPL